MIMTCNELPKLPPSDGGVWRRVRTTEFISRFCENPRGYWVNNKKKKLSLKQHERNIKKGITTDTWKTIFNEYPINKDLKDVFKSEPIYHEVFMSMLIEEYKNYKKNGIEEPEAVIKFTKEYRKAQDSILQFIDQFIKQKEPDTKALALGVIYNEFKYMVIYWAWIYCINIYIYMYIYKINYNLIGSANRETQILFENYASNNYANDNFLYKYRKF